MVFRAVLIDQCFCPEYCYCDYDVNLFSVEVCKRHGRSHPKPLPPLQRDPPNIIRNDYSGG